MKNIIGAIIALITFTVIFSSCGGETYADKLKNEEKAINRFIDQNDIKILYEYPSDSVFAENEYYKDKTTGIYLNVINRGNNERPSKERRTTVYLRYDTVYNMLTNEIESSPNWQSETPMNFQYGVPTSYYNSDNYYAASYYLLSQGCVVPLDYNLGNNAQVKLIIPFENGATAQQSAYKPLYFSNLRYTFTLDSPVE
ncbi:MAG: DUF4827 family protein [Dysgonomonas sp.]